jgi:hypothetical protein
MVKVGNCIAAWNILWQFGRFHGILVDFMAIW